MSETVTRIKSKTNAAFGKPMDGWDLRRNGLPIDHFYRRFIEIGADRCPRCEHHHMVVGWRTLKKRKGWEWVCMHCAQRWREPQITPLLDEPDPENPKVTITRYK